MQTLQRLVQLLLYSAEVFSDNTRRYWRSLSETRSSVRLLNESWKEMT